MLYLSSLIFIGLYILGMIIGKNKIAKAVGDRFQYIVFALIFVMALWAGYSLTTFALARLVIYSLVYAITIIAITYLVGILTKFSLASKLQKIDKAKSQFQWKYIVIFLTGLSLGLLRPTLPYDITIQYMLYILAFVAGISIREYLNKESLLKSLKATIYSVSLAFIGAIISAAVLVFLWGVTSFQLALGITVANGWYSFDGPFLSVYFGSAAGVLGFLTNFLREQLTFIIVPTLARILPFPEPLIAIGGATSMDTTLGVYMTVLSKKEDSIVAMMSGVIITILVPIVLPLITIFK